MKHLPKILVSGFSLLCATACIGLPEQSAKDALVVRSHADCEGLSYFAEGETLIVIAYSGAWAERLCARLYVQDGNYRVATGLVLVTADGERQVASAENISEEAANVLLADVQNRLAAIAQRSPPACVLPNRTMIIGGSEQSLEVSANGETSTINRHVREGAAKIACQDDGNELIDNAANAILKLAPLNVGNVCDPKTTRQVCRLLPEFSIGS